MKGVPVFSIRRRGKACAVCGFGLKDGVPLFAGPPGSGDSWACAKHLRFVSSTPVDDWTQRVVDGLADGSIR